eukprot:scaffold137610_cov23-Cyclotella_meneghiniana.AAC.1
MIAILLKVTILTFDVSSIASISMPMLIELNRRLNCLHRILSGVHGIRLPVMLFVKVEVTGHCVCRCKLLQVAVK